MTTISIKHLLSNNDSQRKNKLEVLAVCNSPLTSHTHTHKPMQ